MALLQLCRVHIPVRNSTNSPIALLLDNNGANNSSQSAHLTAFSNSASCFHHGVDVRLFDSSSSSSSNRRGAAAGSLLQASPSGNFIVLSQKGKPLSHLKELSTMVCLSKGTGPSLLSSSRETKHLCGISRLEQPAVGCLGSVLQRTRREVVCEGLGDFVGGDLLGFDLGKWVEDVETYGSIAVYAPPEGGYEGRYATRLKAEGYKFLNMSARGLGDPEAYLTKVHAVRPNRGPKSIREVLALVMEVIGTMQAHLGKQAVARWYFPPEVDYRLSVLPKNSKGLILWIIEAQVLSKTELQFLALLPALRPNVKVIAECGSWRKFRWKPLKEVSGLPLNMETGVVSKAGPKVSQVKQEIETEQEVETEKKVETEQKVETEEKQAPVTLSS